jgi:hypothetical protein
MKPSTRWWFWSNQVKAEFKFCDGGQALACRWMYLVTPLSPATSPVGIDPQNSTILESDRTEIDKDLSSMFSADLRDSLGNEPF